MIKKLKNSPILLLSILFSIMSTLPFVWMITTSLKSNQALFSIPIEWIPKNPSLSSYESIFAIKGFGKSIFNSFFITLTSTTLTLLSSSLAAFVFAKGQFKNKEKLFYLFLISMMIPIQVTGIPLFIILSKYKLTNTYFGVIAPSIFNAFAIFLLRQNLMKLPDAYIEAALIDGAKFHQLFFKVVLPLIKIPLITLFIINFMNYWNDYYWPLLMLNNPNKMTLPIILSKLNSQFGTKYNLLMAGTLVSVVPIMLVYSFSQKYFIEGFEKGGIK